MSGELMLEFCPKQLILNHRRFLYIRKAFKSIVGYRFRAGINLKGKHKLKPKGVSHH
jgi:hypothetical protein